MGVGPFKRRDRRHGDDVCGCMASARVCMVNVHISPRVKSAHTQAQPASEPTTCNTQCTFQCHKQ